jgi:hypothetical protein
LSTPVDADDLVQGAVKYLTPLPDIRAVLGRYPMADEPYLFQHQWWVNLEGTGSTGLRVFRDGGWSTPNLHNTMRFHRLGLELHCDPLRDTDKNTVEPGETYRRIEAAYRAVDRRMHRPQGGDMWWGTRITMACLRLAEPVVTTVPEGDGMLRLLVFYGVTEG